MERLKEENYGPQNIQNQAPFFSPRTHCPKRLKTLTKTHDTTLLSPRETHGSRNETPRTLLSPFEQQAGAT